MAEKNEYGINFGTDESYRQIEIERGEFNRKWDKLKFDGLDDRQIIEEMYKEEEKNAEETKGKTFKPTDPEIVKLFAMLEAERKQMSDMGMTESEIDKEFRKRNVESNIKRYNEETGDLKYLDCPICKNKGEIALLNDDGEETYAECKCMKTRRTYQMIDLQGLLSSVQNYTFENFKAIEPWQKSLKETALKFASSDLKSWFLVCGQSGAGKTHICTAIVGKLLERGIAVTYMPYVSEMQKLMALRYDKEQYENEISDFKTAKVLYIDDFMKIIGERGGNELKTVFEIIDYRYNNRLTTIISSELTTNKLSAIDIAIAGRIKERCKEIVNIGYEKNKNYRGV